MRPALAAFAVTFLATGAGAAEREYWVGFHDFAVHDVDSHTVGVTGRLAFDKQTRSGRHILGSVDVFVDHDVDELDPDHIPVRWDVYLGTNGNLWNGAHSHLGWTAEFDTRTNTVSSIEREITAFPTLIAKYDGARFQPSIKAGAGWFFLEIDDDVPKTRGYDRGDLRNSRFAYTAAANAVINIGAHWRIIGQAQQWRDSHEWLQNDFDAELHFGLSDAKRGGELVLSADYYEYNIDVYQRAGELPIIPWNDDLLIQLLYKIAR